MTYQLSNGNPDGTVLGQDADDKVAFHGATPVAQAATFAAVTTTAPTLTVYGFQNTAQFYAVINNINSMRTALINKGIIASS